MGWARDLGARFPHLMPACAEGTAYEGVLDVAGAEDDAEEACGGPLWLRVDGIPRGGNEGRAPLGLGCASVRLSPALRALLADEGQAHGGAGGLARARAKLAGSANVLQFAEEMRHAAETRLGQHRAAAAVAADARGLLPLPAFLALAAEVRAVASRGAGRFTCVEDGLRTLSYRIDDAGGRTHVLSVRARASTSGGDRYALECMADLPGGPRFEPSPQAQAGEGGLPPLAAACVAFERAVRAHQAAWDALACLDAGPCSVVDPPPRNGTPSHACTHRRIRIACPPQSEGGPGASLDLAVDVSPFLDGRPAPPRLHALGRIPPGLADRLAPQAVRAAWCEGEAILTNLACVLGFALAAPEAEAGGAGGGGDGVEDDEGVCGICYGRGALEEGGRPPEVTCENARCGRVFHRECLVEWLQSDLSSRQTFNTLFGTCPYCSEPVACKITANTE